MFENAIAQLKAKGIDASDIWGSTAASGVGDSHEKQSGRKVEECDILDKHSPDITGYVVSAQRSSKIVGLVDVLLAVKSVEIPAECKHVWKLPSGAVAHAVLTKTKTGEKIAGPHVYADTCGFMTINGIVRISVKADKAGPKGTNLTPEHLPQSAEITLNGVVYNTSVSKTTGNVGVYGSARSIELPHAAVPRSAVERENKLFANIAAECPGVTLQTARAMLANLGYELEGNEVTEHMRSTLKEDAAAMKVALEHVAALKDHRVGVKCAWETPVLSGDALNSVSCVIKNLQGFCDGDNEVCDAASVRSLQQLFAFDTSAFHSIPVMSFGAEPNFYKEVGAFSTGIGPLTNALRIVPDIVKPHVGVVYETLFTPSAKALDRSDDDKKKRSIGAFSVDACAFTVSVRNGDSWDALLPKIDDGSSLVSKVFKISPKNGFFQNALGVYDCWGTQMVFHEIIKYAHALFFDSFPVAKAPCLTDRQPTLSDGNWGNANMTSNHIGVAGAVSRAGVRVTLDFIKKNVTDAGGVVVAKDNWQEIGQPNSNGGFQSPDPPKLETHGYWAINGVPDANLVSKIGRAASPKDDVEFYAVYEGCAGEIAENPELNKNASVGSDHIDAKFGGGKIALQDRIKEEVVVYAILVSKKNTSVGDKRAAESSDEEEPPLKK
jgi:hypothetical protein